MKKSLKIIYFSFAGGFTGFTAWLVIYILNKTPDIEFDGPAGLLMISSTLFGILIFGFFGTIFILKNNQTTKVIKNKG